MTRCNGMPTPPTNIWRRRWNCAVRRVLNGECSPASRLRRSGGAAATIVTSRATIRHRAIVSARSSADADVSRNGSDRPALPASSYATGYRSVIVGNHPHHLIERSVSLSDRAGQPRRFAMQQDTGREPLERRTIRVRSSARTPLRLRRSWATRARFLLCVG